MLIASTNVATVSNAGVSVLRSPSIETRVPAGFPSPLDDYHRIKIDLNKGLARNLIPVFIVRVCDDVIVEDNI